MITDAQTGKSFLDGSNTDFSWYLLDRKKNEYIQDYYFPPNC